MPAPVLDLSPPVYSAPSRRNIFVNTTEMYLRTIYELQEESNGVEPKRAELRCRLGITRSAVSQHVERLCADGLAIVSPAQRIVLTDVGRATATTVMRKHRLAERMLADVIGLEWHLVHAEATRLQHVLGLDVERRLVQLLDDPRTSPFGCPIPGLAELDPMWSSVVAPDPAPRLVRLADAVAAGDRCVVLNRVPEGLQPDRDLLTSMQSKGAVPGRTVRITHAGPDVVRIDAGGGEVEIHTAVARSLVVNRQSVPSGSDPADGACGR